MIKDGKSIPKPNRVLIFPQVKTQHPPARGRCYVTCAAFSYKPYVFDMDGIFHYTLQIRNSEPNYLYFKARETVPQKTLLTLSHLAFANDGVNPWYLTKCLLITCS